MSDFPRGHQWGFDPTGVSLTTSVHQTPPLPSLWLLMSRRERKVPGLAQPLGRPGAKLPSP